MAPLSTTALIGQLKAGLFVEFVETVNKHFDSNDGDDVSAGKVVKTVAAFVYEKEIAKEFVEDVVKVVATCEVIINKEHRADIFLKELFGNISHIMNRLVKQELSQGIVTLATTFFRIQGRVVNKEMMNNMVHNLYVMLWNFAFKVEPSMKSEEEILSLINIQFCALKFLTLLHKSERFTVAKLVDKVMSSTRLIFKKNSSQAVCDLLRVKILEVVDNPVMEQGLHRWEICCFLVEMFTKYSEGDMTELLSQCRGLLGSDYTGEVEYLQFLTVLRGERSVSQVLSVSIQPSSTPALFSLADILISSMLPSISAELLPLCSSTIMVLTRMVTPSTAMVASRLLTSLSTWLLATLKGASPSPELVNLSTTLMSDHARCFSLLPSSTDGRHIKSCVSSLAINSFNLAVVLYNKKLFSPCQQLLEESCRSCHAWAQLEQQRTASLRPRLKLLAEVLLKMGQFKECLRMFSNSLVVLLIHEAETVQADKLAEGGRFWIGVKREWIVAEPENTDVHSVSVISLLGEDAVFGMPAAEPVVLARLGRQETSWYRHVYLPGCDLTQSWVNSAGRLMKLSNIDTDRGMVLLEQTWVFWLGDNLEDLELGVRCAEKALVLLAGLQQSGLAWYWRYMCEHRLLMLQVQESMVRAGEERMMGRKEREGVGIGEEQEETEPTPAFPGLEMSVQSKLVGFLEQALDVWENNEFVASDWMVGKVMLQFILATAWEMERMGHSGVRAFVLVRNLGLKMGEMEETLLAQVEIVRSGDMGELVELVRIGKELETKKSNSAVACQVGLAVAHVAMTGGEMGLAREVLGKMVDSAVLKQNSLKCNLVGSEARLIGSILRVQVGEWVDTSSQGLDNCGPLEMALEAWKLAVLCYKWWEQDVRTPSSQDPFLLWMGPRLCVMQLKCVEQLASLFKQISSPRELKCYLKEGLKVAQWQCLPLQTASLLVSLAEAHLLCDDEVAASVQLDGVLFVLSSLLGEKKMKSKNVENDNSEVVKLPGQDDQSMSPALAKQHHQPPPFLDHPDSCSCRPCSLPLLHRTILGTTFTQAWCLYMGGQVETASTLSSMGITIYTTFSRKSEAIALKCGVSQQIVNQQLSGMYLSCLLQEGECKAWLGDWDRVVQVGMARKDVISKVSEQWLAAQPALLVRHFEQERSTQDAVEKETKKLEEKKAADEETLAMRLEKLEVRETSSSSNTPTAGQPSTRAIGAPCKRLIPSLGLGDPDTLAKNLEETLSLVTVDCEEQEQKPKMKAVKRGAGRPRLFSAADLATNIKKVVPKLVLSEGTPRRFFKSKGSSSELVDTPAREQTTSTPSIATLSGLKQKNKLQKPESRSKLPLVKKTSSSHSLKENVYEIFEDDQLKTPAPGSRKTSTRTSTRKTTARKASLADACDESLVIKSVSKPPRMAKLVEDEPATRSSARRKAALKRL